MKVLNAVQDFFQQNIAPVHKIISARKKDEEWRVIVEVIEEKEYMKKYARDQMVGVYEVFLDEQLDISGFSRIRLRYRTEIDEQVET
ncbi:gas vesicle protein [Halobacillus kuroshimensis]|uniref:Gas vesicle protein GvpR n=2 Tax=Halobacillus TaxID=45667 RepID=A0A845E5I9_9BACI|nr:MULTISPECIES: gas vesicle protein GvpO [Halobacillus]MBN8235281.1 gas vesicle protein [Halobacillus kuroshimensis]MYL20904.1 gas vesicle protein GvpR [Halobacillus litoralis]MYL30944.1 gas vesicle protein GvpR [Halobacillus halophilus]MYL36255.1 gas vesicle protein GvpR [Halobacillus litoralis]